MLDKITLRPAKQEDSQRILYWRNDERTRSFSVNTDLVPAETHDIWFSTILSLQPERIFIAQKQDVPVGSVRRDFKDDGVYLSWMVNPEYRGRGAGETMLREFILSYPDTYKALIKQDNAASIHIAEKCGFVCSGNLGTLILFIKDL